MSSRPIAGGGHIHLRVETASIKGIAAALTMALLLPHLMSPALGSPRGNARDAASVFRWFAVRIVAGGRTTGSGLVVRGMKGDVLAISAASVVGRASAVTVINEEGREHPGRVVYRDSATSVVLIRVDKWVGPRLADIDERLPADGEELVVYAFDRTQSRFRGVEVNAIRSQPLWIRGASPLPLGFEGGPVITLNKRLAGILTSRDGRAVPGRTLLPVISRYLSFPQPQPGNQVHPPPQLQPRDQVESAIYVFPAGSSISIDGDPRGQAPLSTSLARIEPGDHKISAAIKDRLSIVRQVRLSSTSPIAILFLPPPLRYLEDKVASTVTSALSSGDARAAEVALREYLSEPNAKIDARVHLATALWLQNKSDEAIGILRDFIRLIGRSYRSIDAFILRGIIYEERREYARALTDYKYALMVHPAFSKLFEEPVQWTPQAIRQYKEEVRQNPRGAAPRIRLGRAYELVGGRLTLDAAEQFRIVLFQSPPPIASGTKQPSPASAWSVLTFPNGAYIHIGSRVMRSPLSGTTLGETPVSIRIKAAGYLDMTKVIDPKQQRGDLLLVLPPVLNLSGRSPLANQNIEKGIASFASGSWEDAARLLNEALVSDQKLYKLLPYIGLALFMQGRFAEALDILQKYLRIGTKDALAVVAYGLRGAIFAEQRRWRDALTAYKLGLELHRDMAAVKALQVPCTDRDIVDLQKQIADRPDDPRIRYRLGVGYECKGRLEDGAGVLRDALFLLGPP